MKKVLGAAAGLLIMLVSIAPAGQTVSAAGTTSSPSSSATSWDWPK